MSYLPLSYLELNDINQCWTIKDVEFGMIELHVLLT